MGEIFSDLPAWALAAVFLAAAAVVWLSGARLTRVVDQLALRTGMGHAFAGMLLLAGITSLPEVATVGTAAASGSPQLAVANLLGSCAINVLLLAALDPLIGRGPMTAFIAKSSTLMQGVLSMMVLVAVAAAMSGGDIAVFGIGMWTAALAVLAVGAFRLSSLYEGRSPWAPSEDHGRLAREVQEKDTKRAGERPSLARLWGVTIAASAAVFVAGAFLSWSGDAIAERSGLGQSYVGFLLVGLSTSLTEVTTVATAYRIGRYEMAVGNIFGTNIFNMILLLLVDVLHGGGPVLNQTGSFDVVATLLAAFMTGVFVLGLLERRDRAVLRMGYDSAVVILLFVAGAALLYPLSRA